jgi:trimeric autotransporter adhesin
MKASILFVTGLVLAAGALVGSGSAQAGEGGAAGSVAIQFGNGNASGVADISSAISVGKNGAATTGRTTTTDTYASAIGGGSQLTGTLINTANATFNAEGSDTINAPTELATAQNNTFATGGQATLSGSGAANPASIVLP